MVVYDQNLAVKEKDRGTCAFYAVLGAIVDRYSLDTPQEKLEEYIDASKRRKAGIPWIMQYLKTHPFEGYKCAEKPTWDVFFNVKQARMDAPKAMQFKNLARFDEKIVIVLIKTHKTDPDKRLSIDLNKDHFLVSYPGLPNVEDHAVYLRGFKQGHPHVFTLTNSWGDDFGNKGEFYITQDHLYNEVTAVYTFLPEKV